MSVQIAVVGGGSSYTPEIIEGLILRHRELPVSKLWLVDVADGQERLEIIGALARRMIAKAGVNCQVCTTINRLDALPGADYVITQLRVGQIDARINDERIGLEAGMLGQETNGIGGFAKALRTIPVILDICRDMEELCPDAWLINFTNPAGMVTEAVLNHSKIRAVGLCNVPVIMRNSIADALSLKPEEFLFHAAGLNHMVWGMHVWHEGKDRQSEVIDELFDKGIGRPGNIADIQWNESQIRQQGLLPCPYHRYYYLTHEMLQAELADYHSKGCRGEVVKQVEAELFEIYKNPELNEKPKQLEQRGGAFYSDAACELINAIHNDKRSLMIVNVKNKGAIDCLPYDAAIEATCVVGAHGATPLTIDRFPIAARGLIQSMKAFEQLTIEAAITGDYGTALQALTHNVLVTSGQPAIDVLNQVLKTNAVYLPQFKK